MIFICSWFDLQNNCSDFWIIFQILSKNGKIGSGAGMAEIVKPCIDTWEYYMVVLQNSLEVLINDTDTGKVTLSILDFFFIVFIGWNGERVGFVVVGVVCFYFFFHLVASTDVCIGSFSNLEALPGLVRENRDITLRNMSYSDPFIICLIAKKMRITRKRMGENIVMVN